MQRPAALRPVRARGLEKVKKRTERLKELWNSYITLKVIPHKKVKSHIFYNDFIKIGRFLQKIG